MRILHCLRAPVGGLFRHVLDLSAAQAALGHQVGLIAANDPGDALSEAKFEAVAPSLQLGIHRVAMPRLPGAGDLLACRAIARRALSTRADVLHGHGAKGGAYGRLAGSWLKRSGRGPKVFYTPHGGSLHFPPASLEGRFYRALERRFDRLTDGIIFESAFAERTYGERIGPGTAPRQVIHNGLSEADFAPVTPLANAADILFIGELRHLKGVDVLLAAMARLLSERGKAVSAVIVGDGGEAEELKQLAARLRLTGVVRFPGAMPAREAFPLGRVLAVPSRKESLPYVVLEAAAAGVPVVATDVGGIGEIMAGSDTPLVPAGDEAVLALALARVIDDPDMAQARARRLRVAVSERFTIARMTEDILAFYAANQLLPG